MMERPPGMNFEQRERAIGMLTPGMLAREVDTTPRNDNKSTTEQTQANWECCDRPRSRRPYRFLSSRKLGHLLRNAAGTRVCHRTVRNRLHAA